MAERNLSVDRSSRYFPAPSGTASIAVVPFDRVARAAATQIGTRLAPR